MYKVERIGNQLESKSSYKHIHLLVRALLNLFVTRIEKNKKVGLWPLNNIDEVYANFSSTKFSKLPL